MVERRELCVRGAVVADRSECGSSSVVRKRRGNTVVVERWGLQLVVAVVAVAVVAVAVVAQL